MAGQEPTAPDFVRVAEVAIESVRPVTHGFELKGRGADDAEYRLEMDLELPVDQTTRRVLGELLAQSDWRIWRRAPQPLGRLARTRRPKKVP